MKNGQWKDEQAAGQWKKASHAGARRKEGMAEIPSGQVKNQLNGQKDSVGEEGEEKPAGVRHGRKSGRKEEEGRKEEALPGGGGRTARHRCAPARATTPWRSTTRSANARARLRGAAYKSAPRVSATRKRFITVAL